MDSDVRYSLRLLLLASLLAVFPCTVEAQTVRVQNDATVTVERELDVPGDLGTASGGSLSFSGGAALTLSGSSSQSVSAAFTVPDLTLDNTNGAALNAAVDVSGTLTLAGGALTTNGNLTLTSTGESASARIAGSGTGTIDGDVTAERFIEYQDGSSDGSHWRFLASPVDAALDDADGSGEGSTGDRASLLSNMWTQGDGMTGANAQNSGLDPSVFFYEEGAGVSDPQEGWAAVGDLTDPTSGSNIENREGFAVFLFEDRDFDGTDEGFPLTLKATGSVANANTGTDVTLPVTCTDNDGGDPGNDGCDDDVDGWNLVANPFLSHFDWTSGSVTTAELDDPAYIYDSDNDRYQLTDGTNSNGGDEFIAPFQAFFVKSSASSENDNVSLKVNSGAKADPSGSDDREFKSVDNEPLVSLQLSDGTQAEETRLTYRNGAEPGKDRYDGYQLTPLSGNYHFLASEMAGREALFDSQYRPAPAEADTIALVLDVTESGTYTLETDTLQNLPSGWKVILEDTDSGARWDLGAGESVSFEVEAAQSTSAAEATSPAELLEDGPTVAKASTDGTLPSYRLFVGPAAALPVELASFDARAAGTDVQLSWQTASETGNAGFAVERKAQGGSWSQVGFLEGAGTTEQAQTYRFTDTDVPFEAETVRYRLRQKDLGGSTTLSDEVTAQLGSPSKARLHAPFPNPARRQATLRYEVPERLEGTPVEIALYNTLGQRVRTVATGPGEAGRTERSLDVSGLSSGTYFLRMTAGPATETKRISVVR